MLPFLYRPCRSVFSSWTDPAWIDLRRQLLEDSSEVKVLPHCSRAPQLAQNLAKSMLRKDPKLRPSASDVMDSPWLGNRIGSSWQYISGMWGFTSSDNKARQILLNAVAARLQDDELKESCYHLFDYFDRSHLGYIDRSEFRQVLASLGHNNTKADEIFDRADVSKSGTLEYIEFVALTYDWRSLDEATFNEILQDFLVDLGAYSGGQISSQTFESFFSGLVQSSQLEELLQASGSTSEIAAFVRASVYISAGRQCS